MKTKLTLKLQDRTWFVSQNGQAMVEIHLDYCAQVQEVVIDKSVPEPVQLEVLRLAASHVMQYVRNRRTPLFGGLMVQEERNSGLTDADSVRFMDFSLVPEEIKKMDQATLLSGLKQVGVDVVIADHKTAEEAVTAALSLVGVERLSYIVLPQHGIFANEMAVEFSVGKPHTFTFWKCENRPSDERYDLHIVPSYHPVMNGKKSVGMINGDTDAFIRGNSVRSIFCPTEAGAGKEFLGGSWTHVFHPYRATGATFRTELIRTKIRSKEGVNTLVELLKGALEQNDRYVEVSGGFWPPLRYSANRLNEIGRRSPYPRADHSGSGNTTRGSEAHCVWAHRVLEAEGVLAQSYIPCWFTKEGWLDIYQGAEIRHGIY